MDTNEKIIRIDDKVTVGESVTTNIEDNVVDITPSETTFDDETKKVITETIPDKLQELSDGIDENKDKISEMIDKIEAVPGIDEDIKVEKGDFDEILKLYNLTDEEASSLINTILAFKGNANYACYDELPEKIKNIADGFAKAEQDAARSKGVMNYSDKYAKERAAKYILVSFMNDVQFDKAIDEYQNELNKARAEINKEYDLLFTTAINDVFNKINDIKLDNPEEAARLERIKQSFDDAMSFSRQLEYLDYTNRKRLEKYNSAKKFLNEAIYFNKKVNTTDIRIPDISELPAIIEKHLDKGEYSPETIIQFVSVIISTTVKLNITGKDNIHNLAYIYKIVNNIYNYKYIDNPVDDNTYTTIFENIRKVLDKLESIV